MPRRTEFLAAALSRFAKYGFLGTSTRDICADVGIAHSGIYNYFPTKGAILSALVEQEMRPLVAGAEKILETHSQAAPLRKLEQLLQYTAGVAIAQRDTWTLFQDMGRYLDKDDRKTFIGHRDRYEAMLRAALEEAIGTGALPPQDVSVVIFYFFGMVDGMARWFRPRGRLKPQALARHASTFFIAALKSGVSAAMPPEALMDSRLPAE